LTACNPLGDIEDLRQQLFDARADLVVLRTEVQNLTKELEGLREKVSTAERDRTSQSLDRIAYLTPGSDGYQTVAYQLGVLTVNHQSGRLRAN
jgi:hypothetical protein